MGHGHHHCDQRHALARYYSASYHSVLTRRRVYWTTLSLHSLADQTARRRQCPHLGARYVVRARLTSAPTQAVRKPGRISGQSVQIIGERLLLIGHCVASFRQDSPALIQRPFILRFGSCASRAGNAHHTAMRPAARPHGACERLPASPCPPRPTSP